MLVFAPNLEEIEEICGGCVDLNELLVWVGHWIWDGSNCHVLWSIEVFFNLNGAHIEKFLCSTRLQKLCKGRIEAFCVVSWAIVGVKGCTLDAFAGRGRRRENNRGVRERRLYCRLWNEVPSHLLRRFVDGAATRGNNIR